MSNIIASLEFDEEVKSELEALNRLYDEYYSRINEAKKASKITINGLLNFFYLSPITFFKDDLQDAASKSTLLKNMKTIKEWIESDDNTGEGDVIQSINEGDNDFDFNIIFSDREVYDYFKDKPAIYLHHMTYSFDNSMKINMDMYKNGDFKFFKRIYREFIRVNEAEGATPAYSPIFTQIFIVDIIFRFILVYYSVEDYNNCFNAFNNFFISYLYHYDNFEKYLSVFQNYEHIFDVALSIDGRFLSDYGVVEFEEYFNMNRFLNNYDHSQPLEWNMELFLLR